MSGGWSDKLLQHVLFCETVLADGFHEDPALKEQRNAKAFRSKNEHNPEFVTSLVKFIVFKSLILNLLPAVRGKPLNSMVP